MALQAVGQNGCDSGVPHIQDMLERALEDTDFQDTTIELADGNIRAHGLILAAASDAVRGMLTNGAARTSRSLSWKEHTTQVGRFFLRLLYTGYADATDWRDSDERTEEVEPPLYLLLGSLAIAHMYQFHGVLDQLLASLKRRLDGNNFNEIFKAAIQHDVLSLRTHCLMLASSVSSLNGPWFPGRYKSVVDAVSIGAHFSILEEDSDDDELGELSKHDIVEIVQVRAQRGRIEEPMEGWVSIVGSHGSVLLESCDAAKIKEDYLSQKLSPEVCYELRSLYGNRISATSRKRRRVSV